MKKAILARKVGMTQIYDEKGRVIPVTVLEAGPCKIVQKKTVDQEGYQAVQLGFKEVNSSRVNQPLRGHFQKWGVSPCKHVKEFRLKDVESYHPGDELKADIFTAGEKVDVSSFTKGKGFAGAIKRHGQGRGPKTHGSHYHRGPGTLGAIDPSRVFKGQTLPGRMGGRRVTTQNLEVVEADGGKNLLLIKGAVPGPRGSIVEVKEAVKAASSD